MHGAPRTMNKQAADPSSPAPAGRVLAHLMRRALTELEAIAEAEAHPPPATIQRRPPRRWNFKAGTTRPGP